MLTDAVTGGFTVAISIFDIAVVGLAQLELDVITTQILSPLANPTVVNVGELAPTGLELMNH